MFENIVGHEIQKVTLSKLIDSNKISHAYLFFGNEGIGKYRLALEFSKKILQVDNLESCPDFKVIRKMEDKKDIVVEQIRKEIIDEIYFVPVSGERKVYIIDGAEQLNRAAQNTLLKTLEEPPRYVTIILIASNISAFLPTILSRVNQISFEGVEDSELKLYIEKKYNVILEDKIIEYIDGSIGKAIGIIEKNIIEEFNNIDKLYLKIKEKDVVSSFKISSSINFSNADLLNYLEFLIYKDNRYNCIKFIENAKIRLKFNGNYDIIIDSMLLRLIDNI